MILFYFHKLVFLTRIKNWQSKTNFVSRQKEQRVDKPMAERIASSEYGHEFKFFEQEKN